MCSHQIPFHWMIFPVRVDAIFIEKFKIIHTRSHSFLFFREYKFGDPMEKLFSNLLIKQTIKQTKQANVIYYK